jgi:hypothetical protein
MSVMACATSRCVLQINKRFFGRVNAAVQNPHRTVLVPGDVFKLKQKREIMIGSLHGVILLFLDGLASLLVYALLLRYTPCRRKTPRAQLRALRRQPDTAVSGRVVGVPGSTPEFRLFVLHPDGGFDHKSGPAEFFCLYQDPRRVVSRFCIDEAETFGFEPVFSQR